MDQKRGKIKAVIFDIGNVIIFYDHMIAAKKMSDLINAKPNEVFETLNGRRNAFSVVSDLGAPSSKYWGVAARTLGIKNIQPRKFDEIWNTIFLPNKKLISLTKKLRKKYEIVALSNINVSHKKYLLNKYNLRKLFDFLVLSCDVKKRKPNPGIYKIALKKLNTMPSEVIFVDDKHENVNAAKKLGMKTILFRNNRQFFNEIKKFNL